MSWCYIQQISRILEQNSEAKKSWKHLPQLLKGQQRTLWGWFFVCVYFFRSENNVEYLWKWHTAQWQMPKLSTIWIAISDNYSFNTDKIPDRFMIPNSSSLSEMGKLTLTDSQTCFTSSKCDHPKTLTVWCISPPKLLVSSVKFLFVLLGSSG